VPKDTLSSSKFFRATWEGQGHRRQLPIRPPSEGKKEKERKVKKERKWKRMDEKSSHQSKEECGSTAFSHLLFSVSVVAPPEFRD